MRPFYAFGDIFISFEIVFKQWRMPVPAHVCSLYEYTSVCTYFLCVFLPSRVRCDRCFCKCNRLNYQQKPFVCLQTKKKLTLNKNVSVYCQAVKTTFQTHEKERVNYYYLT